jgi:hypothetical protein
LIDDNRLGKFRIQLLAKKKWISKLGKTIFTCLQPWDTIGINK